MTANFPLTHTEAHTHTHKTEAPPCVAVTNKCCCCCCCCVVADGTGYKKTWTNDIQRAGERRKQKKLWGEGYIKTTTKKVGFSGYLRSARWTQPHDKRASSAISNAQSTRHGPRPGSRYASQCTDESLDCSGAESSKLENKKLGRRRTARQEKNKTSTFSIYIPTRSPAQKLPRSTSPAPAESATPPG